MMKKKVIAVAYSDLHSHIWKLYNEDGRRNNVARDTFRAVSKLCIKHNVPALFLGDMFHAYDEIPAESIIDTFIAYKECFEDPMLMHFSISGNHDFIGKNSFNNQSKSMLNAFSTVFSSFKLLDFQIGNTKDLFIAGIPYNNGNVDFKKYFKYFVKQGSSVKNKFKILLLHTDWPKAVDTSGYELKSYNNITPGIQKLSREFDLVLCGHIHKHQVINNLVIVGSSSQQRISDINNNMGILLIYNDTSVEQVGIDSIPKFVEYTGKKPDGKDLYIKVEEPLVEKAIQTRIEELSEYNNPKKVAKAYIKHVGVKSKLKKKTLISIL